VIDGEAEADDEPDEIADQVGAGAHSGSVTLRQEAGELTVQGVMIDSDFRGEDLQ
jgi:hypothetical protein